MLLDLSKAAEAITKATTDKVRARWSGGKIEIDERAFLQRLADGVAMVMGQNLFKGLRPDGSGPMPGREKDGRPRGKTAAIARALAAIQQGDKLEWLIAAHRENVGHLARIMQEVPFKAPPLETLKTWINEAFKRSVKVGELASALKSRPVNELGRALRQGGVGLRPRKLATVTTKGQRAELGSFGQIGKALKPKKVSRPFGSALKRKPRSR